MTRGANEELAYVRLEPGTVAGYLGNICESEVATHVSHTSVEYKFGTGLNSLLCFCTETMLTTFGHIYTLTVVQSSVWEPLGGR